MKNSDFFLLIVLLLGITDKLSTSPFAHIFWTIMGVVYFILMIIAIIKKD